MRYETQHAEAALISRLISIGSRCEVGQARPHRCASGHAEMNREACMIAWKEARPDGAPQLRP